MLESPLQKQDNGGENKARRGSCKDHGWGEIIQFQCWPLREEANSSVWFPKDPCELEMMQAGVIHYPTGKKLRQWPCSAKLREALRFGVEGNQTIGQDQGTESSLSYSDKDRKETKDSNT